MKRAKKRVLMAILMVGGEFVLVMEGLEVEIEDYNEGPAD